MNTLFNQREQPLLGAILPQVGFADSKFGTFESITGIQGLAFVSSDGTCLELLAVVATRKGKGCLRNFMRRAKEVFSLIRVWDVINPLMKVILDRYGFVSGFDMDQYGEMQEVWEWRKET